MGPTMTESKIFDQPTLRLMSAKKGFTLLALLILVLAGYGLALWYLRVPEERFHLLQYGLVNLFIASALPDKISGLRRHVVLIALACLAGIGDKLLQALRPNRVGDLRDVLINGYSAFLAQGLLVIPTGENGDQTKPNLLRERDCD